MPSLIEEVSLTCFTSLYVIAAEAAKAVMAKLIPIVIERTAANTTALHKQECKKLPVFLFMQGTSHLPIR